MWPIAVNDCRLIAVLEIKLAKYALLPIFASATSSQYCFIHKPFDMKKLNSIAALFLLVFFASCAKEESLLESSEIAPLYQHWALEFDKNVVTGMPYEEKYPDDSGLTAGYEFFSNGKGVDFGFTPHAMFTFEITEDGPDKIISISKNVPNIQVSTNNNYNFEGGCSNNLSNGSGCNNTANFNAEPVQSVVYQTKTESFRIAQLTKSSFKGYMLD
jgi:hypothetical protein